MRELTADEVDRWLSDRAQYLSTRTVRLLHSLLSRIITRAEARDQVLRNVVALCEIPAGCEGRPSKALTLEQAQAVLNEAEKAQPWLYAYIALSILVGARTEELRPLTWDHVDLDGRPHAHPPVPRSIEVWHSVRRGGETKTKKSKRTLALPRRCVVALRAHRIHQRIALESAGKSWRPEGLIFASQAGTQQDSHNVRRAFRQVIKAAGLPPEQWTPREMRHSFVSLLSDNGVPIEDIAQLVGHRGTAVTESVYRKQIRPVLMDGTAVMDRIFNR